MNTSTDFARLLEAFFTDRLMRQRRASPHTIAAYRDTFRLLIKFAAAHLKKAPSSLTLEDMDAPFIGIFLDHIEKDRDNNPRSRNARLAAIHSFFRYAALEEPTHSALIQRVLAMPSKRFDRKPIEFLTQPETEGPGAVTAYGSDRPAGFRNYRAPPPGHCARQWRLRSLPGQGTQGALHPLK
jgi:site-specific recombinase XerD